MKNYKITFKPVARKQLNKIPIKMRSQISESIDRLGNNPHSVPGLKKLVGEHKPPQYRIRQGDYRVIFTIDKKERVVDVIRVMRRKAVYRNFLIYIASLFSE